MHSKIKYIFLLLVVFFLLSSVTLVQIQDRKSNEYEFTSMEIYVYPRSTPLLEENTKQNIKKRAKYIFTTDSEWLPNDDNVYSFMNRLDSCTYLRPGHLDRYIRTYIKINLKHKKDVKIFINYRNEFEIGNEGKIYKADSAKFSAVNALIPLRYRTIGYD